MHTCPPPEALTDYLNNFDSIVGNYGHLLLEQKLPIDDNLIDALRPYFESAHLDAREYFHQQLGISLHPDAGQGVVAAVYPDSLPPIAHRGLFGEVMAGLLTEAYQAKFVGGHKWTIPIFLFRYRDDAEKYLWTLHFDPARTREVYGRHGADFIALALRHNGEVARIIVGEAKWRASLTQGEADALFLGPKERDEETEELKHNGRGIWFEFNRDITIPHGLRQLQRLLQLRDPNGYATTVLSIDNAILGHNPPPGRTNLVLLAGNGAKRRTSGDVLVDWEERPKEYEAPHDLQVIELILDKGETLIDGLYSSLWKDE